MSMTIAAPPVAPPKPEVATPQPAYLERRFPVAIILGSFLVLTLPLCITGLVYPQLLERYFVKPIFMWLLATTHFVITLTIYMQSQNLRYFNSNWTNRLLYFMVPAGIFIFFDLYSALELALILPGFDLVFRGLIRLMDNHHVTRQSFGITQLFKKRSGKQFPGWMRRVEDGFFHMLTALLLITFFAGGKFKPGSPLMLAGAAIAGSMGLAIVIGYLWMMRSSEDRQSLLTPLVYFLLQSGSMALGIYQTTLYLYCLTMHYVEYHVMMVPRCFNTKLDKSSPTDRVFGGLRGNAFVFYGVLIVLAGLATYLTWMTMGVVIRKSWGDRSTADRLLLAVFDGLFVFHYFIEAMIWKFSNPYYRSTLGPLYFGRSRPKPAPVFSSSTNQ